MLAEGTWASFCQKSFLSLEVVLITLKCSCLCFFIELFNTSILFKDPIEVTNVLKTI